MEHLLLKATTTAATDLGEFTAVISTPSVDRDGDIVEPQAVLGSLEKWAAIGKNVPLAYSHRDPATGQAVVVGYIDPASASIEDGEVVTKGWIDQSTERGAETWRLIKSGTLSFSYGFLIPKGGATKRVGKDTGLHITQMDVYEISVVPVAPANNETRVLSFKSLEALSDDDVRAALDDLPTSTQESVLKWAEQQKSAEVAEQQPDKAASVDPLRRQSDELAMQVAIGHVKPGLSQPRTRPPDDETRRKSRELMLTLISKGVNVS